MKTDFTDVSETQKTLAIEIPPDVVDAEINRIARGYAKDVRLPGFRPGKAPASVIKQRFREQIHHDVMHGLVPRAVEEALQERGIEPVDSPNIKDVAHPRGPAAHLHGRHPDRAAVRSGRPRRDRADAGHRPRSPTPPWTRRCSGCANARRRWRPSRAGRWPTATPWWSTWCAPTPTASPSRIADVTRDAGRAGQPAGIRRQPGGPERRATRRRSTWTSPPTTPVAEMAGTKVAYAATVKEVRRRVLPELDDEFAKDLGEFDSLAALTTRVRADLDGRGARKRHPPGPRRPAEGSWRRGWASTRRRRWSSAKSTGGWRNSRDS